MISESRAHLNLHGATGDVVIDNAYRNKYMVLDAGTLAGNTFVVSDDMTPLASEEFFFSAMPSIITMGSYTLTIMGYSISTHVMSLGFFLSCRYNLVTAHWDCHVYYSTADTPYTSNNGLTLTSKNFQLGGNLIKDTTINGNYKLSRSVNLAGQALSIANSHANGVSIYAFNYGSGSSGIAIDAQATGGTAISIGNTDTGKIAYIQKNSASTNATELFMSYKRLTSGGTAAIGLGLYDQYEIEVDDSDPEVITKIEHRLVNATVSGFAGAYAISQAVAAVLTKVFELNQGQFLLPLYGDGTFTGTDTFNLASDANGNIIERRANVVKSASATGTFSALVSHELLYADASGGSVTINLPQASTVANMTIRIKRIDTHSTNTVTLDGNSSETIDGVTTYAMAHFEYITLHCDGSNWTIIG